MTVTWLHNRRKSPNEIIVTGDTTTLLIGKLQNSDAGTYQCVFTDTIDGWTIKTNIILRKFNLLQS